ncbi:Signal transduction histidine kinase [Nocardioides scoriae]|uniref:histidine kinase n=1 Tax=Nocardioides scoriae TaxID=642780 RepID=A0A1H1VNZ9_9ACTN|nr:HAMP domain-containing sensor histidine kinase [Nocardioides scoriae]SDS86664.1 Signal transduction histidine kinase [Nocardioides scoriae]
MNATFRPSQWGLRRRLVWSSALLSMVALALMGGVVLVIALRLNQGRIQATLENRLATTQSRLTLADDGRLRLTRGDSDDVTTGVWVYDADGALLSGPPSGDAVVRVVEGLSRVAVETTYQRGERHYLAEPVDLAGGSERDGVVVASVSEQAYEQANAVLAGGLAALVVVVGAGTAAVTAWTVGRTLRPVQQMTDLAREWSEHDLEARFDLAPGSDELTRLGDTLDELLGRVAQAIRAEQRLTSELAHELRTPLTSIRAEAELGLVGARDDASRERLQRVVAQVDRLSATITALLDLARGTTDDGGGAGGTRVAPVVDSLVAGAPGSDGDADVVVSLDDALLVSAPPELLARVLAPLVDNARRHATHLVGVSGRQDGREVVLRVEDDGPGVTPGSEERVFEAGHRDPGSPGAGLGLPLARRVAASLGGSVRVASLHAPTAFEVRLPR